MIIQHARSFALFLLLLLTLQELVYGLQT